MTQPPAAQPLYTHTVSGPGEAPADAESVNVDALCELYDRSMTPVLYLDRKLTDADKQAVFDSHHLVAEFDAVRGVDTLRKATDDEIAAAEAAKASKDTKATTAPAPASKTVTTSTSRSSA